MSSPFLTNDSGSWHVTWNGASIPVDSVASGFKVYDAIRSGVLSFDEFVSDDAEPPGCECEMDWKCGVCEANGYYHSILDR